MEPNTEFSLPQLMADDMDEAIEKCDYLRNVKSRLETLHGLGYLNFSEATLTLSGGEVRRMKHTSETGREQSDILFVFDEPTIGLHPLDVRTILVAFQNIIGKGATVIIIEHDTDLIPNADYINDMGPGGGESGGRIVATGTPQEIKANPNSITGTYL